MLDNNRLVNSVMCSIRSIFRNRTSNYQHRSSNSSCMGQSESRASATTGRNTKSKSETGCERFHKSQAKKKSARRHMPTKSSPYTTTTQDKDLEHTRAQTELSRVFDNSRIPRGTDGDLGHRQYQYELVQARKYDETQKADCITPPNMTLSNAGADQNCSYFANRGESSAPPSYSHFSASPSSRASHNLPTYDMAMSSNR